MILWQLLLVRTDDGRLHHLSECVTDHEFMSDCEIRYGHIHAWPGVTCGGFEWPHVSMLVDWTGFEAALGWPEAE